MLVDSHCHLDFPDFAPELDAVVERARAAGVGRMVTISTRVKKHAQVLAVAERFPDVFCSVGTHPHHSHEELEVDAKTLISLSKHPKIVAIGEAGLDYHYDTGPHELQAKSFRQHIAAARETGLPLVIHARDCDDDMAQILTEETGQGAFPAVLHCYTGGRALAFKAIDLGLHISFTGILTFKRSDDLRAIAADIAGRPHHGGNGFAVSGAAAVPRQALRAGLRRRDRQGAGGDPRRLRGRDRRADHGELLPAVHQGSASTGA